MDTKSEHRQPLSSIEPNEALKLPLLIIRPQTLNEEFDYLRYVLDTVPFSRQHNYSFEYPDHPEFKRLVEISPNFNGVNWNKIKDVFANQVYEPRFYDSGLRLLENEKPRIERAFPTFLLFRNNWGFKVYPQYDISLTRYGRGGTSYEDSGRIVIMTRKDGTFKRKQPSHTPIHEMVELGIREFAKKYKLTQAERERFVDHLCISGLADSVPDYKFQTDDPDLSQVGDKRVDDFFSVKSLENLTETLERYTERFPRN